MTHFGILCPPAAGHLNPMTTLGYELKRRGHKITLFGVVDAQPKAYAAGLEFWPIAEAEYPQGSVTESLRYLGELDGMAAFNYTIKQYIQGATISFRDTPKAIKAAGVEMLLIDQSLLEGGTIAELINIPFITICSALMLNPEPTVPPIFYFWKYDPSFLGYLRNQIGYFLLEIAGLQLRKLIQDYRHQWHLPSYTNFQDTCSPLAILSQQPGLFEFPRQSLPKNFHFTGPYLNPTARETVNFPFEKLTGQPLIYASLGTVQNRLLWVFHAIAEACVGIDVQLVISLGGAAEPETLLGLPGEPLIVKVAPQLELLRKATLTITHAGLNTTLESLNNGVPMVAIPIANDQPGVAARIAWTGTGEVVPLSHLNVPRLRSAIQKVLTDKSYKQSTIKLQAAIQKAGGVSRAADIVEQVVSTGKPVYR